MPVIDDGPTDGPTGRRLKTAFVSLTIEEAEELLEALRLWREEGVQDPGWHTHLTDADGNELTIAIAPAEGGGERAS